MGRLRRCPVVGFATKVYCLSSFVSFNLLWFLDSSKTAIEYFDIIVVWDVKTHYNAAKAVGTDVAPARGP